MDKIIHIVHGKANPNGSNGISRVVYFLNKYQKLQGHKSEIWAFVDGVKRHETLVRDEFVTIEMFPRLNLWNIWKHSMIQKFQKEPISIVHFHMIWFWDKNLLSRFLRHKQIPFVAMAHGTYSIPLSYRGKKQIARFLLEIPFLNRANELHALTPKEVADLKVYGAKRPAFIVPNGIEPEQIPQNLTSDYFTNTYFNHKIKIGWIGVFREDKNLDLVIDAFGLLPNSIKEQIHFIFMGPDHKKNKDKLIRHTEVNGYSNHFEFYDAVYNRQKYDALNSFDLYIMPSSSEGFSMAILDAMALAKPMILTRGCNMIDDYKSDFYQMCECSPTSIAHAIEAMLTRKHNWSAMGKNGQDLIYKKYNWNYISKSLIANYQRILYGKNE